VGNSCKALDQPPLILVLKEQCSFQWIQIDKLLGFLNKKACHNEAQKLNNKDHFS
jgi:hypothetical protein